MLYECSNLTTELCILKFEKFYSRRLGTALNSDTWAACRNAKHTEIEAQRDPTWRSGPMTDGHAKTAASPAVGRGQGPYK